MQNYADRCGPPRRGAQVLVGSNENINRYLDWPSTASSGGKTVTRRTAYEIALR
jgi:hypothetical protein